jgi:hypothetical protein
MGSNGWQHSRERGSRSTAVVPSLKGLLSTMRTIESPSSLTRPFGQGRPEQIAAEGFLACAVVALGDGGGMQRQAAVGRAQGSEHTWLPVGHAMQRWARALASLGTGGDRAADRCGRQLSQHGVG